MAEAVLARLRAGMERLDVYRGQVLSLTTAMDFSPRGPNAVLTSTPGPRWAATTSCCPTTY